MEQAIHCWFPKKARKCIFTLELTPNVPVNSSNCELRLEQVLDDIAKVLRTARQDIIILYGPPYKNLDPRKNAATDLVRSSISAKFPCLQRSLTRSCKLAALPAFWRISNTPKSDVIFYCVRAAWQRGVLLQPLHASKACPHARSSQAAAAFALFVLFMFFLSGSVVFRIGATPTLRLMI